MLLLLVYLVPGFRVKGALTAILISQLLNAAVFRVDLSRLNMAAVPISSRAAHAMLFVGSIWLDRLLFFDTGPELFGLAQLPGTSAFLFVWNRSHFEQMTDDFHV
ncbi:MAG: hypothetical protein V3T31_09095 [candidate division Zixibacteria bacterium]